MKQFTLAVQQVTTEELEKVLAIQAKSKNAVRWTPQQTNANNVTVPALTSQFVNVTVNNKQEQQQIYSNLRLDWDENGATFAREILDIFTPHHAKEAQAG